MRWAASADSSKMNSVGWGGDALFETIVDIMDVICGGHQGVGCFVLTSLRLASITMFGWVVCELPWRVLGMGSTVMLSGICGRCRLGLRSSGPVMSFCLVSCIGCCSYLPKRSDIFVSMLCFTSADVGVLAFAASLRFPFPVGSGRDSCEGSCVEDDGVC